jgi:hypothetical protein
LELQEPSGVEGELDRWEDRHRTRTTTRSWMTVDMDDSGAFAMGIFKCIQGQCRP